MAARNDYWSRSEAALRYAIARASAPIAGCFPLGITARLTISFSVVAILAAAANLIVEQGVAIVRTTHIEPAVVAPLPPIPAPVAVPQIVPQPVARWEEPRIVTSDFLTLAVDRYERAAAARAEVDTADTAAQFQNAAQELNLAWRNFVSEGASIGASVPRLAGTLNTYQSRGQEFVQLSAKRRVLLAQYSLHLDAMTSRLKGSLDGALTLFGRVLARQSLMHLRTDLDDVRRRFSAITTASTTEDDAVSALESGEAAFSKTFASAQNGLTRSEGGAWVQQMRQDLAELAELRNALSALRSERDASARRFADVRVELLHAVPKNLQARAPKPVSIPDVPRLADAELPPPVAAASAMRPQDTVTTTMVAPEHSRRTLVAWITAGVLALLTAISYFTVRSVLGPVNRMLKATERLASGDTEVAVPRGGIRELDTLAVAFNQMAGQLAAAHQLTVGYQQQLELQVDERTRQLQHLAQHDPLTLLPNRRQLFTLLNSAISRAAVAERYVGVFFLDIDNFKNLNDSMGHAFGDRVLISVAQRLTEIAAGFGFAARLGGDEFTLVYADALSAGAVRDAGWALVQAFHTPLVVDDRELTVSVSVGASVYPNHEQQAEGLLSAADAALFRAKALGRSQLAVFTRELLEVAASKFTTEQGLRRAVERGEFELLYQPEVSLDTLEIGLVEALIRWRQPDGKLALPGEFLAIAEESGLIMEISDWVLREAIQTAARWHHGVWPETRVAINVSPRQLMDHRFAGWVQELLQEFQLPPRCIEFELTETVLQTGPATIETLRRLHAAGIGIALDDFGTGYSSFASLEQLPLTRIKLDRSLIASIDSNARSAAIARAIITLCHSLGLEVTAEGVERPEQFAELVGYRAMTLQGFLICAPVSSVELLRAKADLAPLMQHLLLSGPPASQQTARSVPQQPAPATVDNGPASTARLQHAG